MAGAEPNPIALGACPMSSALMGSGAAASSSDSGGGGCCGGGGGAKALLKGEESLGGWKEVKGGVNQGVVVARGWIADGLVALRDLVDGALNQTF